MKKIWTTLLVSAACLSVALGQQDPMFTKYMFNSLVFNPGYAGSRDHMSIGLLHRTQWYEINGAPQTQSFTLHTPLRNERVAVGLSIVNDKIGPTNTLGGNLIYAYRIPMGAGKLSFGLQAGIEQYRADWSKLNIEKPDEAFDGQENRILPNFGAGIYYYSKHFYIGASSPFLVEYDLRDSATTGIYARQARHYYFMTGVVIPVQGDFILFKPSLLIKNVGLFSSRSVLQSFKDIGAPTEFDIDLSLLFYESLWVGASFRSAIEAFTDKSSSFDSADIWISYVMENGLRVGAAYDYPLSKLSNVTSGAFEVMIGYEFNFKTKKAATPRYF